MVSVLAGHKYQLESRTELLRPLLFLIYINNLPENLQSMVKLFADETHHCFKPCTILILQLVNQRVIWKKVLNRDLSKQAQDVIFSGKSVKLSHPSIIFNTVPVARTICQKHLGFHLDKKLSFYDHINTKISKPDKEIGIIKSLSETPF